MSVEGGHQLILSLETATRGGSIALLRDELLLASRVGVEDTSHSSHLLESIGALLEEAGESLNDVDLFAVASGPGSFTGLRIGLATAKSFSATLNRPCIGVQTLHAVAFGAGESECTLALLPAGRGEVFAQSLALSADGELTPLDQPQHIQPSRLLERLGQKRRLKIAGEGAHIYAEMIRAHAEFLDLSFTSSNATEQQSEVGWTLVLKPEPLAVSVGKLALARARAGENSTPWEVRAIYVRPSDAEIKERCQE